MDPATLAHQVMTVLAPAIPYLSSAGVAAAAKVGEDTYQRGKQLYHAIRARFAQEPDDKANKVLQALIDDPDLSSVVEIKLLHIIQRDPAFAALLLQLTMQTGPEMVIDARDEATIRKNTLKNTKDHGSERIIGRGKAKVEENQMIISNE